MQAFHNSLSTRILSTVLGLGLVTALMVGAVVLTMDGLRNRTENLRRSALQAVYAERVNSLIAMVVMDSRGIYASRDQAEIKMFADGIIRSLAALDDTIKSWLGEIGPNQQAAVEALAVEVARFGDLRRRLIATALDQGITAAREIGESNRTARQSLNKKLDAAAARHGENDIRDTMRAIEDYERNRIGLLLLIGGLGAVLAMTTAWFVVSRTVLRPLEALKASVDSMADGDLKSSVRGTARLDEIGSIARSVEAFRHGLVQMRDIQAREHDYDKAQLARAERVQRAIARFEQAIGDCLAKTHQSIAKVSEIADSLRSLATLSTQESHTLSESAHEAALNAQSVASAAEQLNASVTAIFAQIERSSATAALAARNAEEATTTVDELDGAVAKIGKVVALINEIAEQTNLLALNATIESARAGDAGRGFGVVAAEVKTLAQQTSSATGDIQQQIATVQDAARDAVVVIHRFDTTISDVNESVRAITEAVRQQNSSTKEITESVHASAQSVEAVSRGISGINDGILRSRAASESATTVVASLKDEAARLEQEVSALLKEIQAA